MALYRLRDSAPRIAQSAFISNEATVIGDVAVGERSSVWPGAVIRGDNEPITIGASTNVQEAAVLHADPGCPLTIGENVSIGHQAMLHGCTIGDGSLIGIQAVVMNRAVIGKDCLVGAGAIVTEGKKFPDRSLILGAPAKLVREVTERDLEMMRTNAEDYAKRQARYKTEMQRID